MPDLKMPPEVDLGFYQRRKHDKWRAVDPPDPALEAPVADTHAHIHMLPDPAWELARCAANGVGLVCEICDAAEDGSGPLDSLDAWIAGAEAAVAAAEVDAPGTVPELRVSLGVHPHNAKLYTPEVEALMLDRLGDDRVVAVGEIGLDFHYDLSPRDVQRRVFRRQVEIAKDQGLPIALHLRGGEDPLADNAHRDALAILEEVGFPEAGTLLHCCSLAPDELAPWVDAGCYIAYGGALTFKNSDAAREGARTVPVDRLLLETDSPYMTPEPMRGASCTPAHVIFTAARLAEVRGTEVGEARRAFLQQLFDNTLRFFGC